MIIFGSVFFCCNLYMLGKQNRESLGNLISSIEQKTQLKMIVENIEESIITLQGKKIVIVNESFIKLFQAIIMKVAEELQETGPSSTEKRNSFCKCIFNCLCCCCFCIYKCCKREKDEPVVENAVQEKLI